MAHRHFAISREQTEEFDELAPEPALSNPPSPWYADEYNAYVSGLIALSHADSVRQGLQLHITPEEIIAMIGGTDLRREVDGLSAISAAARSDDNDDNDDERLRHAYSVMDDGDEADDDASAVDDLHNIADVATYSGLSEPC
jgi:hypothetical protein